MWIHRVYLIQSADQWIERLENSKKIFVISLRRLDPSGRRLGQDLLNLQDTESIFCVCLCFCFGLVCLNFSSGKRKVPYSKQKLVKLVQNYIPISLLANEGLRECWKKKSESGWLEKKISVKMRIVCSLYWKKIIDSVRHEIKFIHLADYYCKPRKIELLDMAVYTNISSSW